MVSNAFLMFIPTWRFMIQFDGAHMSSRWMETKAPTIVKGDFSRFSQVDFSPFKQTAVFWKRLLKSLPKSGKIKPQEGKTPFQKLKKRSPKSFFFVCYLQGLNTIYPKPWWILWLPFHLGLERCWCWKLHWLRPKKILKTSRGPKYFCWAIWFFLGGDL